jgi:hypothetical protein
MEISKKNVEMHKYARGFYPIVVMKEVVKESSENRNNRQLFPTPSRSMKCSGAVETAVADQKELDQVIKGLSCGPLW